MEEQTERRREPAAAAIAALPPLPAPPGPARTLRVRVPAVSIVVPARGRTRH